RVTVRLVAARPALNVGIVLQAGMNDLARHRVGERDVRSDVEPEPYVGPGRGARVPRIDDVQLGAVVDPLEQMVKPDRMRLTGVRSPEEDEIGMFGFLVRARAAARPQNCRQ